MNIFGKKASSEDLSIVRRWLDEEHARLRKIKFPERPIDVVSHWVLYTASRFNTLESLKNPYIKIDVKYSGDLPLFEYMCFIYYYVGRWMANHATNEKRIASSLYMLDQMLDLFSKLARFENAKEIFLNRNELYDACGSDSNRHTRVLLDTMAKGISSGKLLPYNANAPMLLSHAEVRSALMQSVESHFASCMPMVNKWLQELFDRAGI